MLTIKEYITSGGKYPGFWEDFIVNPNKDQLAKNAAKIVALASEICSLAGVKPVVTSGWRPESHNKKIGGSLKSKHIWCNAIDLWDPDKSLGEWCVANVEALVERGLYMESLIVTHKSQEKTGRWCHLQSEAPGSGNRIFMP